MNSNPFRSILKEFIGQDRGVFIPKTFIKMLGGSMNAAALLAQIIYWTQRTSDTDGWFYKSAEDWDGELCLSYFQIKGCLKSLSAFGVETKLQKVAGAPTLHYRVNWETLETRFDEYRQTLDFQVSRNSRDSKMDYEETSKSIEHRVHTKSTNTSEPFPEKPETAVGKSAYQIEMDRLKDACAVVFYGANPESRPSLNAQMGRVAPLLHGPGKAGHKTEIGLLKYEQDRRGISVLAIPELVETREALGRFRAWEKRKYPDQTPCSDRATVLSYWDRFRQYEANGAAKALKAMNLRVREPDERDLAVAPGEAK